MKYVKIELPDYAVRYLERMCTKERAWLAEQEFSLQSEASFDSLRAIEDALPAELSADKGT